MTPSIITTKGKFVLSKIKSDWYLLAKLVGKLDWNIEQWLFVVNLWKLFPLKKSILNVFNTQKLYECKT